MGRDGLWGCEWQLLILERNDQDSPWGVESNYPVSLLFKTLPVIAARVKEYLAETLITGDYKKSQARKTSILTDWSYCSLPLDILLRGRSTPHHPSISVPSSLGSAWAVDMLCQKGLGELSLDL